jgi:oligosaccharide repeat unit polymerase
VSTEVLLVVSALLLWLFVLANYTLRQDVLHPACLQSGLWALVITSYCFSQGNLPNITVSTLALILSGVLTFSIGSHAVSLGVPSRVDRWDSVPSFPLKLVSLACLLITAVGLPFFLQRARELGMTGPTDSVLFNIRHAINVEGERFGLLAYLFPVAMISVGIHVMFSKTYSRARVAAVLVLAFAYAILFTGRTFLFLILIYSLGILLVTKRISLWKAFAVFFSIGLTMFAVLGFLLHKGASADGSLLENLISLAQSFQSYLLGPLAALDWLMRQDLSVTMGDNTLRSAYAIYAALDNEQTRIVPLVRDFVSVGVEANVYTLYDPYLRDFGAVGALLFTSVLGVIHGWLYRMTRNGGNPVWVLAYALSLYPLLMQFFQDQYVSLLSSWAQYGALLIVIGILATKSSRTSCAQ